MLEMKTSYNGRRPTVQDDLKILKVEWLGNHWSDLSLILNLNSWEQPWIKIKITYTGRQTTAEDDLKILKVEYFRNLWLDLPQISNLSWRDQTKIKYAWKEDDL